MATIALVGCVKSKRPHPAPAEDLYTSALFRALRAYARRHADRWFILSAEHGLLQPQDVVQPYEKTLLTMAKPARQQWASKVATQLDAVLPAGCRLILLAGQRYREDLEPLLQARGHQIDVPLRGLRLGEQLRQLRKEAALGN
ncbi:hypothetical protein PE066_19065 [Ramlibacter tataouinensis]|uniref:DUF6884 domain-containing protein n=1 Tax=Ramlibacter tataouinensis TaxID=94132 RepID=UPI0022F3B651|nr:DUF6884 domain-containing protein [Ramlibacter tataouinensis]WBY01539.1 hypothetical protein PE066_19065 [Ramlibacter tataouinensis]